MSLFGLVSTALSSSVFFSGLPLSALKEVSE